MTRSGRRLIEDFLLPALNQSKYGDLLKWVDKDRLYFSIRWSHKNAAKWTHEETAVFQDWDRLKGHYRPEIKSYYMQAKQRFRAALYKLNSVRRLPCQDKHVKIYQLVLDPLKRREAYLARRHVPRPKNEELQKSIPTPVICKNTSYIAPPISVKQEAQSPPSSPASSSHSSSDELNPYLLDYRDTPIVKSEIKIKEEPMPFPKNQHMPIQPIPMYTSMLRQQFFDPSQKRYESPHVLLVKTYRDLQDDIQIKPVEYTEECVAAESSTDEILNLSVKSDDSDAASR